jgi:transposase
VNYYIKEREWEAIFKELKTIKGIHTSNISGLRRFLEGVWFLVRSGCQWRLLPKGYGCWRAVHARFKRWSDRGVWKKVFRSVQSDPDLEYTMIDSTIVRAHASAAGYIKDSQTDEALGRSKGGFTTKIHALVDALGNPLEFILTPGQRHDITQAKNLTKNFMGQIFLAYKGYDSNDFIAYLEAEGAEVVIPSKKNRKEQREYDKHFYKERSQIECFFSKIKHFRRIFSRFEKTASSFLSFIYFVGALIWLR